MTGVTDADEVRRTQVAVKEIHAALPAILPRLRRFCLSICGSRDGGDDLCQDAIARALASAHQFTPGTRIDSWLFRIARNVHIDGIRRRKTRGHEVAVDEAAALSGGDGRQVVEARSDMVRVTAGFARLPREQRMLLTLIAIDGFSYKEAAELLEIPVGTVMSRLSRARQALDRHLHMGAEAQS